MPDEQLLQHALVTLAALVASAAIFRRILGFVGTRARRTACSCPSGDKACGRQERGTSAKETGATVHHVTVRTREHTARSSAPPAWTFAWSTPTTSTAFTPARGTRRPVPCSTAPNRSGLRASRPAAASGWLHSIGCRAGEALRGKRVSGGPEPIAARYDAVGGVGLRLIDSPQIAVL